VGRHWLSESKPHRLCPALQPALCKLVQISVAQADNSPSQRLSYRLDKERLRIVRRREGRYLLRSNLIGIDPAQLWELYIRLSARTTLFHSVAHLSSAELHAECPVNENYSINCGRLPAFRAFMGRRGAYRWIAWKHPAADALICKILAGCRLSR
jgi:hypothetical protein